MTRLPLAALIGSLALIGAACGGSDSADAPTTTVLVTTTAPATTAAPTTTAAAGGDSVDAITAEVLRQAEASGIVLDATCVSDVVAKLSDADQQLLVDSIGDESSDPTLSAEGEALGNEMIRCADKSTFVDLIMQQVGNVPGADPACVRTAIEKLDVDALIALGESGGNSTDPAATTLMTDIMACMTGS